MTSDSDDQLEEIYPSGCVELLRTEQLGRIGVVLEGHPEIFPVNYTLDVSDAIVFRTAFGAKLAAAINHHVVFEVDCIDLEWKTGWSVIVHGVAQQTEHVLDGEKALLPWRENVPYLVRISQISISGRRLKSETSLES